MIWEADTVNPYGKVGDFDPGWLNHLGQSAQMWLEDSPIGFVPAVGTLPLLAGLRPGGGLAERFATMQAFSRDKSEMLDPEVANEKYAVGDLSFSKPVRRSVAEYLHNRHVKEQMRAEIFRQSRNFGGPLRPVAGFAAGMGASLLDPINAALMFVPVFGNVPKGASIGARAAGAWRGRGLLNITELGLPEGRIAGKLVEGFVEGGVGGAIQEPFVAAQRRAEGFPYTAQDFAFNVAASALLGSALQAGTWKLADMLGVSSRTASLAEDETVRGIMEDRVVDVEPMLRTDPKRVASTLQSKALLQESLRLRERISEIERRVEAQSRTTPLRPEEIDVSAPRVEAEHVATKTKFEPNVLFKTEYSVEVSQKGRSRVWATQRRELPKDRMIVRAEKLGEPESQTGRWVIERERNGARERIGEFEGSEVKVSKEGEKWRVSWLEEGKARFKSFDTQEKADAAAAKRLEMQGRDKAISAAKTLLAESVSETPAVWGRARFLAQEAQAEISRLNEEMAALAPKEPTTYLGSAARTFANDPVPEGYKSTDPVDIADQMVEDAELITKEIRDMMDENERLQLDTIEEQLKVVDHIAASLNKILPCMKKKL